MQWLTAVLAFATTMLIFSIIVSTLVETYHRARSKRQSGLKMMLEHFYDDVIRPYLSPTPEVLRPDFVKMMMKVRAPAMPSAAGASGGRAGDKSDTTQLNETSSPMQDLGYRWWRDLTYLPVETFMERLGTTEFKAVINRQFKADTDARGVALKDIAQKFELYGQEAGIYFERRARLVSVIIAMVVAWVFYVHPYELITTYLERPEIAASVAEQSDDALERLQAIEERLQVASDDASKAAADGTDPADLLSEIKEELDSARQELEPLRIAGAPIGWSLENSSCLEDLAKNEEEHTKQKNDCWVHIPNSISNFIWLILGGLLVGLGAPFWAKAIRQITQIQSVSKDLRGILKPGMRVATSVPLQTTTTDGEPPITTEAFTKSAAGKTESR